MNAGSLRWKRIGPNDARIVRDFLAEREASCAAAAARFKEIAACGLGKAAPGAAWGGFFVGPDGKAAARSLVVGMKSGLFLLVFDDPEDPANARALSRIIGRRRVSSLQGLARAVSMAELVRNRHRYPFGPASVVDPIDYTLMRLEADPPRESLTKGPADLEIRRAYDTDAELLFPLQAAYELEEVVPKGGAFNPAAARLSFQRALRERLIFYAFLDGKAVGKAGTNASAYAYDQIGGVYVDPSYRGRGIATRIVAELAAALHERNRKATLFVKKRNFPAIRAYERAGFVRGEDYRITYYTEVPR